MRFWYKYLLDFTSSGTYFTPVDSDAESHATAMGGYESDDAYASKEAFFANYFFGYQIGRLEYYDGFLRKHFTPGMEILSIASGRCANELYLMESGYRITCSDLEVIPAYGATKRLFPHLEYVPLNILEGAPLQQYDALICLSLVYMFDDDMLARFFHNVATSLRQGGLLVLDPGGAADSTMCWALNDVWVKYETILKKQYVNLFRRQRCGLNIKHFGFRRTDEEILYLAKCAGLHCIDRQDFAFLTEFWRSPLLWNMIDRSDWFKRLMIRVGKHMPYIRMFAFKKSAEREKS